MLGIVFSGSCVGIAQAQSSPAGSCRASAARVTAGSAGAVEPVVANPSGSPCTTQSQHLAEAAPIGSITLSEPQAATRRDPGVLAASAGVQGATIADGVSVGVVRATQVQSCTNGVSTASGTSTVDALVVGGTPVPIVEGRSIDQTIGPVRIRTNQVSGDTRQALVVDVGDAHVVLGEATASGDACASTGDGGSGDGGSGGSGGSGGDTPGKLCPTGATYDVPSGNCVITVSSGGGVDGSAESRIVVGKPYAGPSGGRVMALSEAQALSKAGKLPRSRCLQGRGPKYVVLGTNKHDHITGTNHDDRILGLGGNDRIDGGRGRDCIDGNTGGDTLTGGEGADRVYGASGKDHLNGGPNTDRLFGGTGNDTINTAFGRDWVDAGRGNDVVNSATAGPPARVHGGKGRDKVRLNRNERRRVRGAEVVYVIR